MASFTTATEYSTMRKKNYWIDMGDGVPAHNAFFEDLGIASDLADDVGGAVRIADDCLSYRNLDRKITEYHRALPSWREGQCVFQAIGSLSPDIADFISDDPDVDPYYNDENISRAVSTYMRMTRG